MQKAKDYLDNLALAIQPYATALQRKSQQDDLNYSQEENKSLAGKGERLQADRKLLNYQISENERESKVAHLARRKVRLNRKIDENIFALTESNNSIKQQIAALSLLKL
jgi:hypothetical protein